MLSTQEMVRQTEAAEREIARLMERPDAIKAAFEVLRRNLFLEFSATDIANGAERERIFLKARAYDDLLAEMVNMARKGRSEDIKR